MQKDEETGQQYGHAGVPDLVQIFREHTRHILIVHFGSWLYRSVVNARRRLEALGRANGVTLHVGHDDMELDLDELE